MSRSKSKAGNFVSAQVLGWLGSENVSASVLITAQRLLSLQESLACQLPIALQKHFVVLKWGDGELKLGTQGSAQASKLRQFAPRMQQKMTELGHKIDAITIKVLAEPPVPAAAYLVKEARPLEKGDLEHFVALANSLEPGPLADAVAKLIARRKTL